jgi:hypothetical protein
MLDVRFPIGALFFILGIMIAAWGYTHAPIGAIAAKIGPLPINWDVLWGIIMTIFGVAMFSWAKLDEALAMEQQVKEEKTRASAAELGAAIAAAPEASSVVVTAPASAFSEAAPEAGKTQSENPAATTDGAEK